MARDLLRVFWEMCTGPRVLSLECVGTYRIVFESSGAWNSTVKSRFTKRESDPCGWAGQARGRQRQRRTTRDLEAPARRASASSIPLLSPRLTQPQKGDHAVTSLPTLALDRTRRESLAHFFVGQDLCFLNFLDRISQAGTAAVAASAVAGESGGAKRARDFCDFVSKSRIEGQTRSDSDDR